MFNDDIFETVDPVEVETEITEEPEDFMIGVIKCKNKLNLRVEPHASADVVKTLDKGSEVVVYPEESTEDFYKVCTESGLEGYCMKKFVVIQ